MRAASLALLAALCGAEKAEDRVTSLPGFEAESWPFKVYSGFLQVPGPINSYDSLSIHYQFHTSQRNPSKDPVVTWHQGGPGGSSILVGLYGEMGVFQIGEDADYLNPWAWNKVANMLYLESPAGSGDVAGYSTCVRGGKAVGCVWDDVTQAEAYTHALKAFYQAFPEFAANDLYLTGESYFGQYGPNIANFILNTEPFKSTLPLKGIALGNSCWGGTETCVKCNGPSTEKINVDLFFGKGLYAPSLHKQIYDTCKFPDNYDICSEDDVLAPECRALVTEMYRQVGPHNVYNIYDNCPLTNQLLERTGKDMGWLLTYLRDNMHDTQAANRELMRLNGGFQWDCLGNVTKWITSPEVKKALHIDAVQPGASAFSYNTSGPASVTLYPKLVGKLRILIYSGDADACVPYNGSEEYVDELEARGLIKRTQPWTPWYTDKNRPPAGSLTKYSVPGSDKDFSFQTVRLAGHMVPQFMPKPGFVMFSNFLAGASAPAEIVV